MKFSVVMPQLGLTMTEGTVSQWLRKPGDKVQKGEFLFVVSTDKADMEVESMTEGTLSEIVVEAGKTVPVGTVIAYIERPENETGSFETQAEIVARGQDPKPIRMENRISTMHGAPPIRESIRSARPSASPRARRLAKDLGVDLKTLQGTGRGGRILEEDVRKAAQVAGSQRTAHSDRRRQLIASKMVQSAQTIPQFTVGIEVNAEAVLALEKSFRGPDEGSAAVKITVTDMLLKTVAIALRKTPKMNSVWEEEKIRPLVSVDLGLAIATEEGVVNPVIHDIGEMDLETIARRRAELVEKARQRKLSLHDLEGAAGTLSNLGMHRIDQFQAMITPGQSFVLATGQIRKRPWVEGEALTIRSTIILCLSVDHRVADGVVAAEFIRKIAEVIENPQGIR